MLRRHEVTREVLDKIREVLRQCAQFDRRTTGGDDYIAWAMACGDLPLEEMLEAVVEYYCETEEDPWLTPAVLRRRVRAKQRNRIERAFVPPPDPEAAKLPSAYLRELRDTLKGLASGTAERGMTIVGNALPGRAFLLELPAAGTPAEELRIADPDKRAAYEEDLEKIRKRRETKTTLPVSDEYSRAQSFLGTFDDDQERQAYLDRARELLGERASERAVTVVAAELAREDVRQAEVEQ